MLTASPEAGRQQQQAGGAEGEEDEEEGTHTPDLLADSDPPDMDIDELPALSSPGAPAVGTPRKLFEDPPPPASQSKTFVQKIT